MIARLQHVDKVYANGVVALRGLDLDVGEGEFLSLLGPSGCGKSTILRLVAGLEDADSGEITIGGRLVNFVDPVRRNVAMVFQNYALYPRACARRWRWSDSTASSRRFRVSCRAA